VFLVRESPNPIVAALVCAEPGAIDAVDFSAQWSEGVLGARLRATSTVGPLAELPGAPMVLREIHHRETKDAIAYAWAVPPGTPISSALVAGADVKTVLTVAMSTAADNAQVSVPVPDKPPVPEPAPEPVQAPQQPAPVRAQPNVATMLTKFAASRVGAGQLGITMPALARTYGGLTPPSQYWWGVAIAGMVILALAIGLPVICVGRKTRFGPWPPRTTPSSS
jgi:hypothetical protein